MLIKESRIPLHMQLAEALRGQIRRRELLPNDRLPSERELCDQYRISRITVRKALSTLAQEGLVHSAIGKGTFVIEAAFDEELQPLSSFSQDLARRGMKSSSLTLAQAVIPADDGLAEILELPRGAEVVRLHRLRLADGLPIALQLTYLPHHVCPDLLNHDFSGRSLYEILRVVYGLVLCRSTTEIMAALAKPEEANLLKLKRPAAVLISEQTTLLDNGMVIEFTRSVFNAERYRLHTQT